jgi:hypothetical protein
LPISYWQLKILKFFVIFWRFSPLTDVISPRHLVTVFEKKQGRSILLAINFFSIIVEKRIDDRWPMIGVKKKLITKSLKKPFYLLNRENARLWGGDNLAWVKDSLARSQTLDRYCSLPAAGWFRVQNNCCPNFRAGYCTFCYIVVIVQSSQTTCALPTLNIRNKNISFVGYSNYWIGIMFSAGFFNISFIWMSCVMDLNFYAYRLNYRWFKIDIFKFILKQFKTNVFNIIK